MRPAYVVFARDKEKWVGECVKAILAQTYSPMDIFFSDQGSTDNTLAVIKDVVNGYNGPNSVYVLECPDTEPKGMAGLIAHFNWLHKTIDNEFFITCAADDIDMPERAQVTMDAIEKLDKMPLYVGVGQHFADHDLMSHSVNAWPKRSCWVTAAGERMPRSCKPSSKS